MTSINHHVLFVGSILVLACLNCVNTGCSGVDSEDYRAVLKRILIIEIDEQTLSRYGGSWPVRRSLHARVIDDLTKAGAISIFYDIHFADKNVFSSDDDQRLVEAIKKSGRVVLPTLSTATTPFGSMLTNVLYGSDVIIRDKHGAVKYVEPFNEDLKLSGCAALLAISCVGTNSNSAKLKRVSIKRPKHMPKHLSLATLLEMDDSERMTLVQDKIVIVGITFWATGLMKTSWGSSVTRNDVHAIAVANFLLMREGSGTVTLQRVSGSEK